MEGTRRGTTVILAKGNLALGLALQVADSKSENWELGTENWFLHFCNLTSAFYTPRKISSPRRTSSSVSTPTVSKGVSAT